ncbi:MAG: type II toxin-antitoxin system VapC family toxin [Terriglobales bacterium]
MVIDTSALVAIFLGEPERDEFLRHILEAETKMISAANALETGIVVEAKRGESAGREFDLFLVKARIELVPVDAEQVEIARSAWRRYGKGRHPAGLNFGDCFAYALAKSSDEKLLAKGGDFPVTDVALV